MTKSRTCTWNFHAQIIFESHFSTDRESVCVDSCLAPGRPQKTNWVWCSTGFERRMEAVNLRQEMISSTHWSQTKTIRTDQWSRCFWMCVRPPGPESGFNKPEVSHNTTQLPVSGRWIIRLALSLLPRAERAAETDPNYWSRGSQTPCFDCVSEIFKLLSQIQRINSLKTSENIFKLLNSDAKIVNDYIISPLLD